MITTVQVIPPAQLVLAFIPVAVVVVVLFKWSLNAGNALYALARMLTQLLLIGYVLGYIFESSNLLLILGVLSIMVFASSWIALGSIEIPRLQLLWPTLISIVIGAGFTLSIVALAVLNLSPWYSPQYLIPLAGMALAGSMNSISLAAERICAEMKRGVLYQQARKIALQASMIPIVNTLFAVGLVSLPGMMTGQILAGVSPLIAVRYQIMVLCMLFGAAGISCICFLILNKNMFVSLQTASPQDT